MSLFTVVIATIVLLALALFALSIGLVFGKRGLRSGCCGNPDSHAGADCHAQTPSCGDCKPVHSDGHCRSGQG